MSKLHSNGPLSFWGKVDDDRRPRARSKAVIACELLEGRALLTGPGSLPTSPIAGAITRFQADLHAIAAKSQVTISEQTALSDALKKDQADATSRPTAASLSALQTEITTEAQNGTLNTATLLSDEAAILTSAHVPTADVTATTTAQSAIFTSSGVNGTDLKTIYTDLQAIPKATPIPGSFGGNGSFGGFSGNLGQTTSVLSSVLNIPIGSISQLSGNHPIPPRHAPPPTPVQAAQAKLQTDLHTLAAKSQVTVAQLTTLNDAFEKARKDATHKPTADSITALETEIDNEAQAGTLDPSAIEADIAAVLTSAGIPTADATAVTQALDAVITSSGITGSDLQLIYNDQQALKAVLPTNPPIGVLGPVLGLGNHH